MVDPDLGLTIVFNGCIYNYRELREELRKLGYRFFSTGDTEVVLKAWHAWGEQCVDRMHGMFAFAIHERDSGRLVLARDRFGIKPLYLNHTRGSLAVRVDPAGPAGGWRRRYLHRYHRVASLHELPRGRAAAADHSQRRAQTAAGDRQGRRARRQRTRSPLLESALYPLAGGRRDVGARTGVMPSWLPLRVPSTAG